MKTVAAQKAQVKVCESTDEMGKEAAAEFSRIVNEAVASRGKATVALSGGSTPSLLYQKLSSSEFKSKIPWDKIHFFVGDERCVALDDKESNFGKAQRELLSLVGVPEENEHPLSDPQGSAYDSAKNYDQLVREFFELKDGAWPAFDLILLGMGPDGHTASLFPNTKALKEQKRIVIDNNVGKLHANRITFTFPAINSARNVLIMVQGEEKAHVIDEVLKQPNSDSYPIQNVVPTAGNLQWILDRSAAADFLSE